MIRWLALKWAERVMTRRPPDFIIGEPEEPYLLRWYIIPRSNKWNIYLHKFLHDDSDEALHDHPWANLSWVLSEGYTEITPLGAYARPPGSLTIRRAIDLHRIVLNRGFGYPPHPARPAISLFLTGRKVRIWGFDCPKGWIPFTQFADADTRSSQRGKGCP